MRIFRWAIFLGAVICSRSDRMNATRRDPRIVELDERIEAADGAERQRLRTERAALLDSVRNEKMGELAAKFDSIHSIERAVEVGSVNSIVAAGSLRPYLVDAIERGMRKAAGAELSALSGST